MFACMPVNASRPTHGIPVRVNKACLGLKEKYELASAHKHRSKSFPSPLFLCLYIPDIGVYIHGSAADALLAHLPHFAYVPAAQEAHVETRARTHKHTHATWQYNTDISTHTHACAHTCLQS